MRVCLIQPAIVRRGCTEEVRFKLKNENVGREASDREMFSRPSSYPEECK